MGFYLQAPSNKGKAQYLITKHGAKQVPEVEAFFAMVDKAVGVVCVVNNGPFEAAAFAYDTKEFEAFADPADPRPKVWLTMERKLAEELSGFANR